MVPRNTGLPRPWYILFVVTTCFLVITAGSGGAQEAQSPTSPFPSPPPEVFPAGVAAPTAKTASSEPIPGIRREVSRLGVGDLLEISVYGVPELSQKVRVNSTGDIYLPLIDYLHVDKLTPEDTQAAIEKKLVDGGFVKNPHVTIMITESAGAGVSVLGEVARPGVYPVLGQRRLFDVISAAGGFTEKAGKAVTITHRNQPEQPVAIKLEAQLSEGPQNNVEISPGDTIVVARAGIFYVVGDVVRPSGFIIDSDNVSVLKAVALAGGPNRTAALGKVTLIRKTPQGFHQTSVPLKKILEAKAPDVLLQPEDILFIPVSRGKVLGTRTMEAAVQLATGVGIVAVTRF